MAPRLPLRTSEITPAWLTGALAERYPGTEVVSVRPDRAVGGMATKVHLEIAYNDAGQRHGLPAQAWLKGGLDEAAPGHVASYVAEARFFDRWAQGIPANLPRVYWTGIEEGRQGLVLMEDLDTRGARYGYATTPLEADEAHGAVALLASVHARYWNAPALSVLTSYTGRFAAADYPLPRFLERDHYRACMQGPRGETAPAPLRRSEGMWKALRALWAVTDQGPQCFCHGDAHVGNFFFEADGAAGLLDWQAYLRSHPLFDVAYFLCGALRIADRRRHERDLLAGYLDALRASKAADAPTFDQAWLAYRRFALHGLIWAGVRDGSKYADEMPTTYALRYGAACEDLETLSALGL